MTVTSTAAFRIGTKANVSDDNTAGVLVIVTEITDSTHMKVRIITPTANQPDQGLNLKLNAISYGTSDMSAYTTAQNARVDAPQQFIWNADTVV